MTASNKTAKKKAPSRRAVPPGNDDESPVDNGFPVSEEVGADIEEFMSDQDDRALVMVYRIAKPGGRDGFLDTMSVSAITNPSCQQVIRDTYGPGDYKLKLKTPNARGVMCWAGSKTVSIAERPGAAVTGGRTTGHGTDDYFREESNKQQQLILALIASQKPQQLDLAGLAALMSALSGGNKQSDLGAVVAAFTSLKAAAEPSDTVAQIQKALELARSINGGPAPAASAAAGDGELDTSWPGIIKGALSAFSGMQSPRATRQLPAAAPSEPEYEESESEEELLQKFLFGQIRFLKSKAQAGKPVEAWIQYTVDNAEEPGSQAIFEALKAGATFDHLLAIDGEIAQTPALRLWFQQFYDGIKRSLQPTPTYPWIVGNPANTADNAAPGDTGQSAANSAQGSGNAGKPGSN